MSEDSNQEKTFSRNAAMTQRGILGQDDRMNGLRGPQFGDNLMNFAYAHKTARPLQITHAAIVTTRRFRLAADSSSHAAPRYSPLLP